MNDSLPIAEKDAPESACGVTFSHDWHGYLDDDGRTRVCDGEPLPRKDKTMPDPVTPPPRRHAHGENLPESYDLPLGTTGTCSCGRPLIVRLSDGPWASNVWRVRRWWNR